MPKTINKILCRIAEFLSGKSKTPGPASPEAASRFRTDSAPEPLLREIEQLQKANRSLSGRAGKLQEYSRKLETLHQVIIRLQGCNSPRALRSCLVREIYHTLQFDRCAFLEVDAQALRLTVSETCGFEPGKWEKLNIRYPAAVFQNLFRSSALLLFTSPAKIPDPPTRQILQEVQARRFLFGLLGAPAPVNHQLAGEESFRELLDNLNPDLYEGIGTGLEKLREHLREYLSWDIFYVGGYLFIDYKSPSKRFTRYDIKILEMLLRTAGLLYQNLQMREQLKAFFIRAEKEAVTDHLTGLFNYRYFIQELHRELDRARRHGSPFVLLMLDVDYFKFYNDAFGHPAGDVVLKKLAKLLQKNTRSSDTVARYGGEEFAAICPELGKEGGMRIAEKLCRMVAAAPFPKEAEFSHQKITISIGAAAFPEDAVSAEELVRRADMALYEAKQNGRNRVRLYREGKEERDA